MGPITVCQQSTDRVQRFQGGDENDYTMVGDGAFHHYDLPIATTCATTIYRLRLDVPANATVAIQSVDIANLIAPAASAGSPTWQFTVDGNSLGWIPYQGVVAIAVGGGSLQLSTYANTTIFAPAAQVTNQLEWFSLIGTVTQSALVGRSTLSCPIAYPGNLRVR